MLARGDRRFYIKTNEWSKGRPRQGNLLTRMETSIAYRNGLKGPLTFVISARKP